MGITIHLLQNFADARVWLLEFFISRSFQLIDSEAAALLSRISIRRGLLLAVRRSPPPEQEENAGITARQAPLENIGTSRPEVYERRRDTSSALILNLAEEVLAVAK
jgi:hypothetical protein